MAEYTTTERRLQEIVAARLDTNPESVDLDLDLVTELGIESFDLMGIVLEIEEEFAPVQLMDESVEGLHSLREVAAHIDETRNRT